MGAATVQPLVRLAPTATRYKNEEMLGVQNVRCAAAQLLAAQTPTSRSGGAASCGGRGATVCAASLGIPAKEPADDSP